MDQSGSERTTSAWKAVALPLSYTRKAAISGLLRSIWQLRKRTSREQTDNTDTAAPELSRNDEPNVRLSFPHSALLPAAIAAAGIAMLATVWLAATPCPGAGVSISIGNMLVAGCPQRGAP